MNTNDKLIDPHVQQHLEILKDTPPREHEKIQAGRQYFLSVAASMKRPVSIARDERHNRWIPTINFKERRSMLTALATIIVAAVMLFGGAGATVFAAQDSVPDDLLYAVKTWSEDIQLSLTNNPQAKFDLVEGYILRRFTETDSMIEEMKPIPPGLASRLENQLNYMLQLASQSKDNEEMESALIRIRSMLQDRIQLMANQGEYIPEWAIPAYAQIQQMLNERLRRIETGIEEPLKFRQQMESPAGGYSPGSGNGSANTEEISPSPTEKFVDKPLGPGPCDTVQEDCDGIGEPEQNVPSEYSGKRGQDQGNQNSGDSSNQEGNSDHGKSTGGGKP